MTKNRLLLPIGVLNMKNKLVWTASTALLLLVGLASIASAQATVYLETFPACGGNDGLYNWYGDQQGREALESTNYFGEIPFGGPERAAINNGAAECPERGGGGTSHAIRYSRAERVGIFLFTDEYSFDTELFAEYKVDVLSHARDTTPGQVVFDATPSPPNTGIYPNGGGINPDDPITSLRPEIRPAFLMGTTWYIADPDDGQAPIPSTATTGLESEDWDTLTFDPSALTYGTASQYGSIRGDGGGSAPCPVGGTCLPRHDGNSGLPLPDGTVDAFGFYIGKNWTQFQTTLNPTIRLDNVEVILDGFSVTGSGTGSGTMVSTTYSLDVTRGTLVNCSYDGSALSNDCSAQFSEFDLLVIEATASAPSVFTGWTGCSEQILPDPTRGTPPPTGNQYCWLFGPTITPERGDDACTFDNPGCSVTANFVAPDTITFAGTGTGSGTMVGSRDTRGIDTVSCTYDGDTNMSTGDCSAQGTFDTTISVTAMASPDSVFTGWANCTSVSGASGEICNVATPPATTRGTNPTATFVARPTITVQGSGTGSGDMNNVSVRGNESASCSYDGAISTGDCTLLGVFGGTVFIEASANVNSTFNGWTNCTRTSGGSNEICEVDTPALQERGGATVTADFVARPTITVSGTGNGLGSMVGPLMRGTLDTINCNYNGSSSTGDCDDLGTFGTTFAIEATAGTSSRFVQWTGCDSVSGPDGEICEIVTDPLPRSRGGNASVQAEFQAQGEIIIRKRLENTERGAPSFGFTVDPADAQFPDFFLEPGQDETVVVDAPFYANVFENDPTSLGYKVTAIECTESSLLPARSTGIARSTTSTSVEERRATVDVGTFEQVDCTFTNAPLEIALSVVKTSEVEETGAGTDVPYEITFLNSGPDPAIGVDIEDIFPDAFIAVEWTCAGDGGAVCPSDSGNTDISETVDIPVGGSLTYSALATLDPVFTGPILNTATATSTNGDVFESNTEDNTDSISVFAGLVTEIPVNPTWALLLLALTIGGVALQRLRP